MALNHKLDKNEINFVDYIYKNTKKNKLTVFDVGCNRGLYVGLFSNKHINSDIHCFEDLQCDELIMNES